MGQLDFSVGIAEETVAYGTAATVTRFFESEAKFKYDVKRTQGKGLRPVKGVQRLNRNTASRFEGSGPIEFDANTKGMGLLLQAVLGTVTNNLVSGGTYQQVHTLDQSGDPKSYTIQEVIPFIGGAGQPHTFLGCVADSMEISVKEGDVVTIKIDFDAQKLSTGIAAAATSYPAVDGLFTFVGGSIVNSGTLTAPTTTALGSLSGTALANVSDPSVMIKRNLDNKGFNLGGAGYRSRKPQRGRPMITGKMTAEYTDNTLRDAYLNKTALPLLLNFASDDGISVLQIIIPSILVNSEVPTTNGGEPASISIDFEGFDNGTAAQPIWIVYRTLDTAP